MPSKWEDNTVRLWDSATGAALDIVSTTSEIYQMSFSSDGLYLQTNRGHLGINSFYSPSKHLCNILVKEHWVTQDMENILWLPSEYRASCTAFYRNILVLGHLSGAITFLAFNPAHMPFK